MNHNEKNWMTSALSTGPFIRAVQMQARLNPQFIKDCISIVQLKNTLKTTNSVSADLKRCR